jgi:hypothetical protein
VSKKSFKVRSAPAKAALLGLAAASIGTVVTAERDLQRRSEPEIRGDKRIWRLVSLNALGAAAYLRFGRRR